MMKKSAAPALLFCLMLSSCNRQAASIDGAWNLVSGRFVVNDTLTYEFPGNVQESNIKIWSGSHFVFAGWFKTHSSTLPIYGYGTFKLRENRYEEFVQYNDNPEFMNQTIKMFLEIKNDTLIQAWPLDNQGQLDSSKLSFEKFIRLK